METYCFTCKTNTANENFSVRRIKQNTSMLLSNCVVCGKKKSVFIKNEKASGLLSRLGVKTPLSNVPLNGDIQL